jgi:hypothetical protein
MEMSPQDLIVSEENNILVVGNGLYCHDKFRVHHTDQSFQRNLDHPRHTWIRWSVRYCWRSPQSVCFFFSTSRPEIDFNSSDPSTEYQIFLLHFLFVSWCRQELLVLLFYPMQYISFHLLHRRTYDRHRYFQVIDENQVVEVEFSTKLVIRALFSKTYRAEL